MTNSSNASSPLPSGAAYRVRDLRPEDRAPIEAILRGTALFSEHEVEIALELIDEGLAKPDDEYAYQFVVAETPDGRLAGYACYGSTPDLPGTYDLYWIAVDRSLQGQGVGKILIHAVEDLIAHQGGSRVVVETSGRSDYRSTRAFYDHTGYNEEGREKDFYSPGDDKVIYVKKLESDDPASSGV